VAQFILAWDAQRQDGGTLPPANALEWFVGAMRVSRTVQVQAECAV